MTDNAHFPTAFCQHLYDLARAQPGVNALYPHASRLLIVQALDDADQIFRRNADNYAKNYSWFSRVAGNSRFTDDGPAWKLRQELSQPDMGKFDDDRAFAISMRQAEQLVRQLGQAPAAHILDEGMIHRSMLSIFTEMFLQVPLERIPMQHNAASRLTEMASQWAFVEPGSEVIANSKQHLLEILQVRKQLFAALQSLRAAEHSGCPMLSRMFHAEQLPGSDFAMEKELAMMLGAGSDTASYAIGWALHLLASHPALQQRLHAGVSKIYAQHGADAPALKAAITDFSDLRCFIAELLRLYPPLPFVPRVATAGDRLSDRQVEAGDLLVVSLVGINLKGLQRDDPWVPDIDAAAVEGLGMGSGMISSFVWGKRICGGRSFALVELACVLSRLILSLHFEPSSDAPVELEWVGQMRRKGGHRLTVTPRSA